MTMGYDMYWKDEPSEDDPRRAEYARLWAIRDVAIKERDAIIPRGHVADDHPLQIAVMSAANAAYAAEVWYFRLNIRGMGQARDELAPLGIVRYDIAERPYPKPEMFGLGREVYDLDEDEPSDEPRVVAWRAASVEWRDAPPEGDEYGIPAYKLGSNDGWLVTPGEIRTGIAFADHTAEDGWRDRLTDYVLDFVRWMEAAAEHGGGFRVY